jgi:hypothetical protein
MGAGAAAIAQVVPEVRERLPDIPGFVATLHLMGVPLCCSTDREVEERRHDRFQRQSI